MFVLIFLFFLYKLRNTMRASCNIFLYLYYKENKKKEKKKGLN